MFIGLAITGDKVWAPSSGTLPSEFFQDIDNDILEENEEENVLNDVHI
ncbi:hypothetical protein Goshw_023809, partial [Gossypium schwendimanii]|nr:hypothetical protein [Gossypium schwendimanii]